MSKDNKVGVLFVCTGNICRSPTAEGIFYNIVKENNLTDKFMIDSAGISSYHVGERPDPRSCTEALKNNIDLSKQKARQINHVDYEIFDYILAMDDGHFERLYFECPLEHKSKIYKFIDFVSSSQHSGVPDPYYGADGFTEVFNIIKEGCNNLFSKINQTNF